MAIDGRSRAVAPRRPGSASTGTSTPSTICGWPDDRVVRHDAQAASTRPFGRGGLRLRRPASATGRAALGNLSPRGPRTTSWPRIVPAALGGGHPLLRHRAALRPRPRGASASARACATYPRDEYVLSTKVGRVLEPNPETGRARATSPTCSTCPPTRRRVYDLSRDGVLRSVEDSLKRLGVDRIDVLFVHDPDEPSGRPLDDGVADAGGAARRRASSAPTAPG